MNAAGQRALVVGLGASGRAASSLLRRLGANVVVTDDSGAPPAEAGGAPLDTRSWIDADSARSSITHFDLVVTSPGVPRGHRVLAAAESAGVEIVSELELGARAVARPIVAVTGTNGKSTTVTLLAEILACAGRRVFVGGNLGNPLCNAVGGDAEICVVETSSFQLEWTTQFHPCAAAILNLSPDHLDRHGTLEEYGATKLRIFAAMGDADHAVLCRDEHWWRGRLGEFRGRLSTFGSSALGEGEFGLVHDHAARVLRDSEGREVRLAGGWPQAPYDFANVAAAAELARTLGAGWDHVIQAVASFDGLDHRLHRVDTIAGVEFWNDSKATNVGATIASLDAFSAPVVLLVGGVGKGASFESLAEAVLARPAVRDVIAFGESSAQIVSAFGNVSRVDAAAAPRVPAVHEAGTMADAFAIAAEVAETGDVVLLAPACASFDEFSGYAERGRVFEKMVAAARATEG